MTFLNRYINEEIYVSQPLGFIDHKFPNHVFKLKKALYGWSKLQDNGIWDLVTFLFLKTIKEDKLIKLFS